MRLIDANRLKELVDNSDEYSVYKMEFKGYVDRCETVDAVEVVHNNCTKQANGYHAYINCTCGCEMSVDIYYWNLLNRCPNCGAKMDGGSK